MTRIYVDKDRCEGSRLCVGTYPQAFAFGDDGYAYVHDDDWSMTVSEEELETARTLCPADAIRVIDQGASNDTAP